MNNFINLLPTVNERFTNLHDFHNFLQDKIYCNDDHEYEYKIDEEDELNDEKLHVADTSVTSVLGSVDYVSRAMQIASIIGKEAHKALELCVDKGKVIEELGYVKEQQRLLREICGCKCSATELPLLVGRKVGNKIVSIGGTVDCISYDNNGFKIIEHKTSTSPSYTKWIQQVVMYAEMYIFLLGIYVKDSAYDIENTNVTVYLNIIKDLYPINIASRPIDRFKDTTGIWVVNFNYYLSTLDSLYTKETVQEVDEKHWTPIRQTIDAIGELRKEIEEVEACKKTLEHRLKLLEDKIPQMIDVDASRVRVCCHAESILIVKEQSIRTMVDNDRAKRIGLFVTKVYEPKIVIVQN